MEERPVIRRDTHPNLACFTVDVEQDCPPYRISCHGMTDGMPRLLDLLSNLRVRATFFTTGEMARRFPAIIHQLVDEGHELGCHGDLHLDFTTLTKAAAAAELRNSLATLRAIAPVTSFRAPYLRYPVDYLPLLIEHGLAIDSSLARYKWGPNHDGRNHVDGLQRIPASVTSSVLRFPSTMRAAWLAAQPGPLMLFVHPWEAVDFRRSNLRWDCRYRTGEVGLRCWKTLLAGLQVDGKIFVPINELAPLLAR